jgi:SAM-dependent methyltransferase
VDLVRLGDPGRRLTEGGYEAIGTDLSAAMIDIARRQAPGATFVHGSLWDLELPPAVGVTAIGEALNYAADPRAGDAAFDDLVARVSRALAPGGAFLFDVSVHGRSGPDRRRVQFHDRPDWSLGMVETEDDDSVTREVTTFTRLPDGRYRRTHERHRLHLYDPARLLAVLRAAGFDAATHPDYLEPDGMAGWVVVVAQRR